MNNQKYYQEVTFDELYQASNEFGNILEESTIKRFVNMHMQCIQDEKAIQEIIFTEKELEEVLYLLYSYLAKKGIQRYSIWYNLIKDVNLGRLEAGIDKELVKKTKSQFEESSYIQTINQSHTGLRAFRTLIEPIPCSLRLCDHEHDFLSIWKMPDDWFWVAFRPIAMGSRNPDKDKLHCYKCDGFFALKKFLEKLTQHE